MRASTLIVPLLALSLVGPASSQEKAMKATRKQQKSLEPMIELVTNRMLLHSATLERKDVERALKDALNVQVSYKAYKRYKDEFAVLLARELDIENKAGVAAAGRYYSKTFGRGPTEAEKELCLPQLPPLPETDDEAEKRRIARERELMNGRRMEVVKYVEELAYPPFSIEGQHKKCVFHDKMAQIDMKSLIEPELDKEQARGMKELAAYYAPKLAAAFSATGDRDFQKRLELALNHQRTAEAMFEVLVKVRVFARPLVYAELNVGLDDPQAVCEAQDEVITKVCETLGETELWSQLTDDHASMLEDAKAFRKALKARVKGG